MIEINGIQLKHQNGRTILDMARQAGIDIPTLCHDERVKTYGACGLCVVEVEGMRNLVRACATEAAAGMKISTDNERVRHSRKLTLELLMSDHNGECRPPCTQACPAGTDCQGYVGLIANHHFKEALMLLKESHPLPLSIGLVCPHPCESACRRQLVESPIAIADLKAFAASQDLSQGQPYLPPLAEPSGKRVAVVGSGPAGLTAAYFLARSGHKVAIYEAMPQPGGMLRYGIPEYRLPKAWLDQEIELIKQLGVEIITATSIPADIDLPTLRQEFDAVFVGIGAWKSSRIGCTGDDHLAVIGGIDFLRQVNMQQEVRIGPRVAVIGGGNTAMDAARTAVRMGAAEAIVLYRRTRAEMPAADIEIAEAEEEGVVFRFLLAPEEIVSNGDKLQGIKMGQMKLGQADSSGRRSPVPTGETEFIEADTIIAAIGQQVNAGGFEATGLNRWRSLDIDPETMSTALAGVFAGGDAVTGPGTAIEAIAQGQRAARCIDRYLQGQVHHQRHSPYVAQKVVTAADYENCPRQPRVYPRHADAQLRRHDFRPVKQIFSIKEARAEAQRCLECGCLDYYECRLIAYAREYQVKPRRWEGEQRDLMPVEQHPFMIKDMNKCILCGLCVRVCDEVIGAAALGLVQRGFDTVVQPEMGLPWQDTSCIACGQCVALCPTGALVERNGEGKNIPLPLAPTVTTCSGCDWGCRQVVQGFHGMIAKVEPVKEGLLCAQGRFAWKGDQTARLTTPMIKRDGRWQQLSWEEALTAMLLSHQHVQAAAGPGSSGVFISPTYTVEEADLAAYIAHGLGADYLSSFTRNSGDWLQRIAGEKRGNDMMLELEQADVILMIGSFKHNHIPAIRVRQAAAQGASLIIISPEGSIADDQAALRICPQDNDVDLLLQVLAALSKKQPPDQGDIDKAQPLYRSPAELAQQVAKQPVSRAAEQIAGLYGNAKRALILVDGYSCSDNAVQVMSGLAALNDPGGAPAHGIMVVSPGGNAGGIWQAGFQLPFQEAYRALGDGEMKTVLLLGEDPVGCGLIGPEVLRRAQLLVVMAPCLNDTARLADIVLPGSTPLETSGTYISADGSLKLLRGVQPPPAGMDNLAVLKAIISHMNLCPALQTKTMPEGKCSRAVHRGEAWAHQDAQACLYLPDRRIFIPPRVADPGWCSFNRMLSRNGGPQ